MNPDRFIAGLRRRGYHVLGQGLYSTVLAKPGSQRVVKVNRSLDGWPDYMLWASKAGYAGTFAPKVYSFKFHGTWYVAVMERLEATIDATRCDNPRGYKIWQQLQRAISGWLADQKELDALVPGAWCFATALRTSGIGATDLHTQNFMLRHDGSVVCTDPVSVPHCRATDSGSKRLRLRDLMPA